METKNMVNNIDQQKEINLSLCRSGLFEALALGFSFPGEMLILRLLNPDQNQALRDMAWFLTRSQQKKNRLPHAITALLDSEEGANLERLKESYHRCFGHTAHPPAPPYETEYGEDTLFQQPQQLSDIAGFYRAFGLYLKHDIFERVDHIVCECEFCAFLARKEAYSLETGDHEMLSQTRRAYYLFLKDHLGRFIPAFSRLVYRVQPRSFYATLAKVANFLIKLECQRLNVPLGPIALRVRPTIETDFCVTCGGGAQAIRTISPQ